MPDQKKRNEQIIPKDTGKIFAIHNGRNYIKLKIKLSMIGHKFGEFVLTRTTKRKHKRIQQRKRKR